MATSEFNLPFVSGLGRALAVAGAATDNAAAIQNLLREFGWQVSLNDQQVSGLKAVLGFSAPVTQLRQLLAALEQDNADKAAIAEGIFQTVHTLYNSITNLSGASLSGLGFPFDRPGFAEEFAEGLAVKLLDDYLQYNLPTLHGALFILGILDAEEVFPTEAGRLAYTRRSIHWDRISKAISDPPGLAADVYGWNTAVFRHRRFLDALELLLEYAGVIAHQVRPSEHLHLLYYDASNHAARAIRSLEIPLFTGRERRLRGGRRSRIDRAAHPAKRRRQLGAAGRLRGNADDLRQGDARHARRRELCHDDGDRQLRDRRRVPRRHPTRRG